MLADEELTQISTPDRSFDALKSHLQGHLTDGLVTVVGSGLSAAEGLPTMAFIAEELRRTVPTRLKPEDAPAWSRIEDELVSGAGLESALSVTAISPELEATITLEVAAPILAAEQQVFLQVVNGVRELRFARLLKHLIKPQAGLPVITPNYDRLIELAAEASSLRVDTMFIGQTVGVLDDKSSHNSFCLDVRLKGKSVSRTFAPRLALYKPHGSLDWYLRGDMPVRLSTELPLPRLIIAPGLSKFKNGYHMPFDKHREMANRAIDGASRFLIIGYGFNDDHLETHLTPKIRSGVPTLLISRALSPKATNMAETLSNVTAIESPGDAALDASRVYWRCEKIAYPRRDLWDVHTFIDEVLEP